MWYYYVDYYFVSKRIGNNFLSFVDNGIILVINYRLSLNLILNSVFFNYLI